jgi:hypothetical protein
MSNINTISEFLLHAGTDFRVFDMGRAIRPLGCQDFFNIESGSNAAPYPRQQHAWFGLVFFQPLNTETHYVWFVKLPVDEQGLVIAAARKQFLEIIVTALAQETSQPLPQQQQLPTNPFTFIPSQQQLADFNSFSRQVLKLPPSSQYQKVLDYLRHPQHTTWQTLQLQGVADVAARTHENSIATLLETNFTQLHHEVQHAICCSLENYPVSDKMTDFLCHWWLNQRDERTILVSVLRATAQSSHILSVKELLQTVLTSSRGDDADVLILVAARHWQHLNDPPLLNLFISRLCAQDKDLFLGLYSDLVQIPQIRTSILGIHQWQDKSTELSFAIAHLNQSHLP